MTYPINEETKAAVQELARIIAEIRLANPEAAKLSDALAAAPDPDWRPSTAMPPNLPGPAGPKPKPRRS